jgi:CRISPR system Cascade subunit CasC
MFLQVHALTSYHATLLNRDDAGLAKRIPFGDAERIRISSQCQKRHWREALAGIIATPGAFRSRHFFDRIILAKLTEKGVDEKKARELVIELMAGLISKKDVAAKKGKKGAAKEADDEGDTDDDTGTDGDSGNNDAGKDDSLSIKQAALFGKPEADYLTALLFSASEMDIKDGKKKIQDALKGDKKNFEAMMRAAGFHDPFTGFEGAMFGRFVTSDVLARTDAAVHVAHAFTVHSAKQEIDFFTVVDDLNRDEETGAAHAGDMDLGAGLFYVYVAVDVPLLVSNFTGCDSKDWQKQDTADAKKAIAALITAIATVSPGAKKGSTAPYSYADLMLLETGTAQPRSLANAYLKAIKPKGDMRDESIKSLADQMAALDKMYGASGKRFAASTRTLSALEGAVTGSLDEITAKALNSAFGE